MESEVLGKNPINHFDFENETGIRSVPLPDEMPAPLDLRHLPKDVLKSSTVENLISQNEDLMARLKVALRRLSSMELENQALAKSAEESQRKAALAEDQSLVLKEKDRAWKNRIREYETEREILAEKIRVLSDRAREQENELVRHRKYHEKIRSQVKPHLMQLKEYSRKLEKQIEELTADQDGKNALIQDLRVQISEVTRNSRHQVELAENRVHELIESYEASLEQASEESKKLKAHNEDLEIKAARLRRTEQVRDELENTVIELRRSKESLSIRFESESRRLGESVENLSKENARFKVENEDMREKISGDFEKIKELQKQNLDLQSQLESLRYLWASRNEENEKLKLSLSSLERLNVDLSSKIQEMRGGSPPLREKA
ncbi:MAG TPA: hypothetical protein PL182_04480 [Pseudobdellovibrionaceae bacterium]|nr:hypothetical protein [Pseudobdellovibrionaceae bacterium]